ncbi:MAG: signal peptidase II [Clostridia bacterium]
MEQQRKTLGYLLLIAVLIALDQCTKWIVDLRMNLFQSIEIWNFIKLTYIHNTGAAFGILEGSRVLFVLFTLALIIAAVLLWKKPWMNRYRGAVSVIIAGALGNCIDRIFRGYVVDFIDFTYWPVFNMADIAVVCGTVLLAFLILTGKEEDLPSLGKKK